MNPRRSCSNIRRSRTWWSNERQRTAESSQRWMRKKGKRKSPELLDTRLLADPCELPDRGRSWWVRLWCPARLGQLLLLGSARTRPKTARPALDQRRSFINSINRVSNSTHECKARKLGSESFPCAAADGMRRAKPSTLARLKAKVSFILHRSHQSCRNLPATLLLSTLPTRIDSFDDGTLMRSNCDIRKSSLMATARLFHR